MPYLLYLLVFLLPFNIRKVIYEFSGEYGTIFFYATDLILLLLLLLNISKIKDFILENRRENIYLGVFVIALFLSVFISSQFLISSYDFLQLILYVGMAIILSQIIKNKKQIFENILIIILGTSLFESLLAFLQFSRQHNFGLWFLGETKFGPLITGVAKISTSYGPLVRPYGTFLHPNILAAFLILGLFSAIYFRLKISQSLLEPKSYEAQLRKILIKKICLNIFLGISIFFLLMGLILTFSRGAWMSFALSVVGLSIYLILFNKSYLKIAVALLVLLSASSVLIYSITRPFVDSRLKVFPGDSSITLRSTYNNLGFYLIKTHPFLGVGIGNQTLYSTENNIYKIFNLNQFWQLEPVHNLYLLIGAEIGLIGLLAFVIFIFKTGWLLSHEPNLEKIIVLVMLDSFLIFGLFDHFFWTINQGKLMLWLVIGLMIGFEFKSTRILPPQAFI